jgi:hypothetical protein
LEHLVVPKPFNRRKDFRLNLRAYLLRICPSGKVCAQSYSAASLFHSSRGKGKSKGDKEDKEKEGRKEKNKTPRPASLCLVGVGVCFALIYCRAVGRMTCESYLLFPSLFLRLFRLPSQQKEKKHITEKETKRGGERKGGRNTSPPPQTNKNKTVKTLLASLASARTRPFSGAAAVHGVDCRRNTAFCFAVRHGHKH